MPASRGSLRRKLLGVMLLTTLAALTVALGAMIAYDLHAYRQGWITSTNALAELLGRTSAPALAFDDSRVARENLALLRYQPEVRVAAIYSTRGGLFATYVAAGVQPDFPALPGPDGVTEGRGSLVVFRRVVENGQILGTVYVLTGYELYDHMLNYAGICLLVAIAGMIVAWLVSSWLQRVVTRPILLIGAAARDVVEQGDYSRRVDKRGDDELGTLIDAFNDMMSEIERRTRALETSNREKADEVDERRRAQGEVMRLNEGLERRVSKRTAELERSNSDLVRASEAAESANRAKSEFLSNMSHELRTPLNAIIGFGQLLASADQIPVSAEQSKAFIEQIVKAGRHLLTLINDILNLAQIEAGKVSISLEAVILSEVLDECRTMTEPLAAQRNIRMLFPPAGRLTVQADRTRLKQVLLNLLTNAVKYNREMGSVAVGCTCPTPERIRISIQDTGAGMRPDQLQALFQPFNRLGQETGVKEGTGIGLVVTRQLVELMNGAIGVSSTPGTGSRFWIELNAGIAGPSAFAPLSAPEPAADLASGTDARYTVLCVEDNAASLFLIQQALSARSDLRLITAIDGHAGVEMARTHRPDVILMDNNMPVLSGAEAHAILRADPRTADIPVIAISANAMPGAVAAGLAAGFFRYLTKPVDLHELEAALDSALDVAAAKKQS